MRIGMLSATYDPTVVNGAVRMVTLYKEHLEARGHEVTIFTLGEETESDKQARMLAQMDIVHAHHLMMSVEMAHRYANCPIVYTNHTRYDLYTGWGNGV